MALQAKSFSSIITTEPQTGPAEEGKACVVGVGGEIWEEEKWGGGENR